MDINTLKNRVDSNLPIYLGTDKVTIISICEFLSIAEIKYENGFTDFTEVKCLYENPDDYKGIPLKLFKPIGGNKC